MDAKSRPVRSYKIANQILALVPPTTGFRKSLRKAVKRAANDHLLYAALLEMMTSYFEHFSLDSPDLAGFVGDYQTLKQEYVPLGPPLSPLTPSYFCYLFLCDLPIAPGVETGFANGNLFPNRRQLAQATRDWWGGEELRVHSTTGYQGEVGQLWLVRLLPPVRGEEHVVVTMPYRLFNAAPQDWIAALNRELLAYQRHGFGFGGESALSRSTA